MLQYDQLLELNRITVDISNEPFEVINKSNLLSALGVQTYPYDTIQEIGASLLRSLCIAHGFRNGNKRTAVQAMNLICPYLCSDKDVRDLVYRISSENGSKISIEEIVNVLYTR